MVSIDSIDLNSEIRKIAHEPEQTYPLYVVSTKNKLAEAQIFAKTGRKRYLLDWRGPQVIQTSAQVQEVTSFGEKSRLYFTAAPNICREWSATNIHIGPYLFGAQTNNPMETSRPQVELKDSSPENYEKDTLIALLDACELDYRMRGDRVDLLGVNTTYIGPEMHKRLNTILYESAEPYRLEISNNRESLVVTHNTSKGMSNRWRYAQTYTINHEGFLGSGMSLADQANMIRFLRLSHYDLTDVRIVSTDMPSQDELRLIVSAKDQEPQI